MSNKVIVRPMVEDDLDEADRIMRLAFGTFLGLPDPVKFAGDADIVHTRYRADPPAALTAEIDGRVVGSNFALDWGSLGVFGPLTIHPDYWDRGVAKELLDQTMKIFEVWGTKHIGIFTFAQSSKHVHLYQKYGLWPRYLTAIMSKQVGKVATSANDVEEISYYSRLSPDEQKEMMHECARLTGSIMEGLDLKKEINSVADQKLGDTILLRAGGSLAAMAVCHCGPGTEAGSGSCYIKFGTVRPSPNSARIFDSLLDACERYARSQNASRIIGGANMGRHNTYRRMIERGFRTEMQGVAMQRPNEPGYNLEEIYLIDDWR
jgi:GNAT superfamily N-acetyltransferase